MIVFLHHSVNPYRVAFFNKLKKAKLDFKVYFLSSPAKNRRWQISDYKLDFKYKFLEGWKIYIPGNDHSYFQINSKVYSQLQKDNPEFIITIGWNYLAAFIAFIYSKLSKKRFVVWSESTEYENSLQRSITLPFVKFIVKKSDFLIAAGTRAMSYLTRLGGNPKKISVAYYSIDNNAYTRQVKRFRNQTQNLKKKYGIKNTDKIVLFVGGLLVRKGVRQLLKIAKKLKSGEDIKFMFVGFGPLLEEMKNYIKRMKLKNIIIPGYIENTKIIKYYLMCDVFILPSLEETWGLVVNEAMCASKPVLVSKYAGSSVDLVSNGVNGYVINPYHITETKNSVLKLLLNPNLRYKMGNASFRMIQKYNLDQNVEVIKKIVNTNEV